VLLRTWAFFPGRKSARARPGFTPESTLHYRQIRAWRESLSSCTGWKSHPQSACVEVPSVGGARNPKLLLTLVLPQRRCRGIIKRGKPRWRHQCRCWAQALQRCLCWWSSL